MLVAIALHAAVLAATKVFILIGQSNMEGHGIVNSSVGANVGNGTLEYALDNHPSASFPVCNISEAAAKREGCNAAGADLDGLRNGGTWRDWPNVQIDYLGKVGDDWGPVQPRGPLTVGFGFDGKHMGPELGFGVEMSKHYGTNESVLLLKVAWGGTSLAEDWRPPSSVEQYGGSLGWCYSNMTTHVHSVLAALAALEAPETAPELVGVVWHQGWNDGCDAGMVAEYERNLANLIRDIRHEFAEYGTPFFSIPVSGLDSWRGTVDRRSGIIHAQYAVTQYAEFASNVAAEETRGFVRFFDETGGACNQGYHFNCNGESYFYVGTVAGQGMSALLDGTWVQPFINTTNPSGKGAAESGSVVDPPGADDAEGCEAVSAAYCPPEAIRARFDEWRATFGIPAYADGEAAGRFERVAAAIRRHEYLSPYSDRTPAEYAAIFPPLDGRPLLPEGRGDTHAPYPFTPFSEAFVAKALAAGVDWRARGAVTGVKSQGSHGVCGTFGQTQSAESQYFLGGGGANPHKQPRPLTPFSEQQLLSCNGGHGEAYIYYSVGLESSQSYPFNQSAWADNDPPPCEMDASKLLAGSTFSNTTSVPTSAGEDQLAAFVFHNGPMQVGISSHVFKGVAGEVRVLSCPRRSPTDAATTVRSPLATSPSVPHPPGPISPHP